MAKVSSKTHTKQQLNDYANQHNPNNKACKANKANKAKMRSKKRKERVDNVADLEWFCYKRMSLALANCGRDILFSACNWGADESKNWMKSTGAHIWRMSGGVFDNWQSISDIYSQQIEMLPYNSTSCFNDMDMPVVGMNGKGNVGFGGCTEEEYKTHFAMWCLFGSPLMIGCDIRMVDEKTLSILKNKGLIDICLDGRGCQPYKVDGSAADVWMRHLENGDIAVAMFNMTDSEKSGFFPFVAAGINSSCSCVPDFCELYTDEKMFEVRDELVTEPIPPHGCKIYRAEVKHCPAQKITVVDTTAAGGTAL